MLDVVSARNGILDLAHRVEGRNIGRGSKRRWMTVQLAGQTNTNMFSPSIADEEPDGGRASNMEASG